MVWNEITAIQWHNVALESRAADQKKTQSPPEHNGLDHCVKYSPLKAVVTRSLQLSGLRLRLTLWPVFILPPHWRHRPPFDASSPPQTPKAYSSVLCTGEEIRQLEGSTIWDQTTQFILSAQSLPSVWSSGFKSYANSPLLPSIIWNLVNAS